MSISPFARVHTFILRSVLCVGLAGCQAFKQSSTWAKVTSVRGKSKFDPDASEQYANRLHNVLKEDSVEHKVVTYQYRYTTRLREEAVGTRTAVLYKDKATPRSPWWLMDDQLGKPIWLPNGNVERQVEFYLHQPAQVVAQSEFPSEGGKAAKAMVAAEPTSRALPTETRIAKGKAPIRRLRDVELAQAATNSAPLVAAALFRLPRLAPEEPASVSMEFADLDRAFRLSHGTDYNPASAKDRRKMGHLEEVLLYDARPAHTQSF